MWIKASGRLSENAVQLSTTVSTHVLMQGETAALVDTSAAAFYQQLLDELDQHLGGLPLGYILLTHTHFDHLGGVAQLRRRFPEAKLIASPRATEILNQPDLLGALYAKNREIAEAAKLEIGVAFEDWCSALAVDRAVNDGDVIDLGEDIHVKVISAPGHTEDSLGFYLPADGVVAAGEAFGGYHGRDKYTCCYFYSYPEYLETIDKVSELEIRVISLPHGGALTGELARKFLTEGRAEASRFFETVRERISQGELVEEIAASLAPEWRLLGYSPDGPFSSALDEGLRQMVRVVAETEVEEE